MEWPPGQLRETSVVFLFSNLWLPDQGLGIRRGESRACGPRMVEDECSQTLPSGCPTAFPKWVWQKGPRQRVFWESCCISGEDAGATLLAAQHLRWFCYSLGWHPCQIGHFLGSAVRGDHPPAKSAGFFFFELFYFLGGFGLFSP